MTATHRIDCPFPPCEAWWNVAANVWRVPYHNVRGPSVPPSFRGAFKCPGALVGLRFGTSEPDTPSRAAMSHRASVYWARVEGVMEAERERVERLRAEGGDVDETPLITPEGREPTDPTPGNILYFPGRPADAPEPGPGESHPPVEIGQGHHLGRSAVDNAHDTTRGLAQLAVNELGKTQEVLSTITAALDAAEAQGVAAEALIHAASALVTAAVGTGENANAAGNEMAEQTAVSLSTIGGDNADNIQAAIQVAKIRVELAVQQIAAAVTKANEYIASLS